ncbi:MAG: radical SAM protein [Patescibacteria group bacterium]|nr:radical SAM protein [Patescibacteria group bacterium]
MQVCLFVNSECNARCKHCCLSYSGSRDPEDSLKIVKQLRDNRHKVIIAGSEILLNPEYLKSYQRAGQNYLLTNGIILDRDKATYDLLRKHGIEELGLSIHFGIQRDLGSVPEDLVVRVIKESRRREFRIKITTTITSGNYSIIEQMCEKATGLDAYMIQFFRFVSIGRGNTRGELALSPEQVDEFFAQVEELRKKYPKSILEIRPHGNFGPRPGSKGERLAKKNRYCPAGKDLVVIDSQNRVYGCPFCMSPENVIGRYEDGKIVIERGILKGKRDTCIAHLLI